jgi:BON domain-containing protein
MVGFEFSVGVLDPFDCRKRPAIDELQFEAERLAAKIEQVVWHATAAGVKNLRVELRGEEVLLTGRCRTYYIKQIAQHAAMQTAVGWSVVNQIDVT